MLREDLTTALKEAMKSKDQTTLSTVRLILAALKDRDIQARTDGNSDGLSEDQILEMLQKMVKQRRESVDFYEKGGRADLVEKEKAEIKVIERFLPQPMSEEEIRTAVDQAVSRLGADSVKDMGRVMGDLKQRYAGRMDFTRASQMVKQQLS
ncbi:GatB/YqeY domain-containing protein [Fodinicurvata halophila]|uniref:GatB/YqeY domain-containing protein n=1 Tax=Fodinicurvata halophila TaxID=1419723 RepID=A0ABV8UP95_9PROT